MTFELAVAPGHGISLGMTSDLLSNDANIIPKKATPSDQTTELCHDRCTGPISTGSSIYSSAGINSAKPAVTGMQPVAVAVLAISTFSALESFSTPNLERNLNPR
jgi:hypothetical protein